MRKIKILNVRFDNELRNDEIELFRGAVVLSSDPVLRND